MGDFVHWEDVYLNSVVQCDSAYTNLGTLTGSKSPGLCWLHIWYLIKVGESVAPDRLFKLDAYCPGCLSP